jgi:hypothetical protein
MAAPEFIADFVRDLPVEDKGRLREVMNLPADGTDDALAESLVPFAEASLAEYVDQFTGRQLPSRMKDLEQLRLLYVARHAFAGKLPDPDKVADLFQKNSSEAKTLLRNTSTRYRYELSKDMNDAVWSVLTTKATTAGTDAWNVEIRDLALLEHVNEAVRRGPGNPAGVQKSKDEMHVYLLDKHTMKALLATIGRELKDFVAAVKERERSERKKGRESADS